MALSTSFTGGWFFLGQFFDHAIAGWEKVPSARTRTEVDVQRSRERMFAPTPAEVIERVANRFSDDLNVRHVIAALKLELEANDLEWRDDYKRLVIARHDQLLASGRTPKAEPDPRDEWMRRRQAALRRAH